MSKYTTGEMAKLCGVSVRTVQYYDNRDLLVPSELSEGGRRLYSEEDLKKLKIICFLRDLGIPLGSIDKLLKEEDPGSVVSILLSEQSSQLKSEIAERERQLAALTQMQNELKSIRHFSVESISDIAYMMKNKTKLTKMRRNMIIVGICADVLEYGTLLIWCFTGVWLPFVIGILLAVGICIWISKYYMDHTAYICPQCHAVFRPSYKETFWARHTPKTRRLTCTACGHKGFCVEVYHEKQQGSDT